MVPPGGAVSQDMNPAQGVSRVPDKSFDRFQVKRVRNQWNDITSGLPGDLLGSLALLAAVARPAAASLQIVNLDGPGEGLNDSTPVAPVGGNAGTTLGQQRMNVLQGVASAWSARLSSPVPILVGAQFDDLDCSSTSATLGSTGPSTVARDFTNAKILFSRFLEFYPDDLLAKMYLHRALEYEQYPPDQAWDAVEVFKKK